VVSSPKDELTDCHIQFLGLAFVGPVSGGFLLITAILFQIGTELGDVSNIAWMPGGWSIASSVSFSIAGSLSDIFGRRYVTLSGQLFAVVGAVSPVPCAPYSPRIM
jgi:MFS family permease